MTVVGTEEVGFSIGPHQSEGILHVSSDLRVSCILGYPWLREQQATLYLRRRCVHFGTGQRATVYWSSSGHAAAAQPADARQLKQEFPADYVEPFQALLDEYPNVTSRSPKHAGTRTVRHKIALKHDRPIQTRAYRVSDDKKMIEKQVQEMLETGIISPHKRRINEATESEPTPMPIIQETLRELGDAGVYSSLDLKSGY